MATELGKAYVQIVPSARGIGKAISSELVPQSKAAGKSAGIGIASKIKGALIAAGIGKALVSTIQEGGKLQQSLGGIETLFKDNAEQVKKYATEAYKTAGLSANAYMENVTGFSASLLQSLGGDTAKAAQVANTAMIDMADNSNKMGTAMESIQDAYQGFAKQNYTMLDNLKLGYGGTKTEMQRLLADATKLTGVKYDINNLSDVYQAIHAVQNELGITGTTAKEAGTTITGSFNAMKASFQNVLGALALGQGLQGALQGLGQTISTFVFQNLVPMLGNIITQLPALISGFWQMAVPQLATMGGSLLQGIMQGITEGIPLFLESFTSFITAIQTWLTTQLPVFLQTGVDWLSNIGLGIFSAIPTLITTMGEVILSLLTAIANSIPLVMQKGFELISNLGQGFLNNLPAIETSITTILTRLINLIIEKGPDILLKGFDLITKFATGLIKNLPAVVSAIGRILLNLIKAIVAKLPTILTKGGELIKKMASGMLSMNASVLSSIGQILLNILNAIAAKLGEIFSKGVELIKSFADGILNNINAGISAINNILSGIVNAITGKVSAFFSAGQNLIKGLWNGIASVKDWIISKIGGFTDSVVSAMKSFFGIHSPSKVFAEIGKFLDLGLAKGILDNVKPVSKAMNELGLAAERDFSSENFKI